MPEKKVIFDATVLSNFIITDATTMIKNLYAHRGIITWEVFDELSSGSTKEPALRDVNLLLTPKCFNLITLSKKEHTFYVTLLDSLGKGEASCIAHARYSRCTVATDDKAARRICERYKISCTGTIGILLSACRDGVLTIEKADQLLQTMVHAGFYSPVRRISDII